MTADPQFMFALATLVGAALFTAAGYGLGRNGSVAVDNDDPAEFDPELNIDPELKRLRTENQWLQTTAETARVSEIAAQDRLRALETTAAAPRARTGGTQIGPAPEPPRTVVPVVPSAAAPARLLGPEASAAERLDDLVATHGCDAAAIVDAEGFVLLARGEPGAEGFGAFGALVLSGLPDSVVVADLHRVVSVVVQGTTRQLHVRELPSTEASPSPFLLLGIGEAPRLDSVDEAGFASAIVRLLDSDLRLRA